MELAVEADLLAVTTVTTLTLEGLMNAREQVVAQKVETQEAVLVHTKHNRTHQRTAD